MATNMTVPANVENIWDPITLKRYHVCTPPLGKMMTVVCATTAARSLAIKAQHQT